MMETHYLELIQQHFGYLVNDLGFKLVSHSYDSKAFGNFLVNYRRGDLHLRIIRDRSQIFIEFTLNGKDWMDKERILDGLGISRLRYNTDEIGFWEGYEIQNQGTDLRNHFELIKNHLTIK